MASIKLLHHFQCLHYTLLLITSIKVPPSQSFSYFAHSRCFRCNNESFSFTLSPLQNRHKRHLPTYTNTLTSLYAEKKYPVIVTGNAYAALGAAMALCTRDLLRQSFGEERPPVPPAQLVALCQYEYTGNDNTEISPLLESSLQDALLFGQYDFFSDSAAEEENSAINNYQQVFSNVNDFLGCIYADENEYGKPIIHTKIGNNKHSNVSGSEKLLLNESIRNSISFLGLDIDMDFVRMDDVSDERTILSKDDAIEWGDKIQTILHDGKTDAAVTMDISTHLAMLQANRLPKCKGALGQHDVWAIKGDIKEGLNIDTGDCMLFEYQYDYQNSFGGTDPLLCLSYGHMIDSSSIPAQSDHFNNQVNANDAYAAAFTALRGSGMDPISSLCVAASVKTLFWTFDSVGVGRGDCQFDNTIAYTWDVIEKIAHYSHQGRLKIIHEDGTPRKKYKEFGYK